MFPGAQEIGDVKVRVQILAAVVLLMSLTACIAPSYSASFPNSLVVQIQTEDRRDVDVGVWPPRHPCKSCNAIIFSHGHSLGITQYNVLFQEWANAGYLIIAPLHIDSEQHADRDQYSPDQYLGARLSDFRAVVQWLESNADESMPDINLSTRYLAAGHSFGALIAQMAGGATVEREGAVLAMEVASLPIGVIAVSPPGPVDGYLSAQGWRQMHRPLLVVTGTEDVVPLFAPTWQSHLASFLAGPTSSSVALTFTGMDHYFNGAFGRVRKTDSDAVSAIHTLNRAILYFANTLSEGKPLSEVAWSEFRSERVQVETL